MRTKVRETYEAMGEEWWGYEPEVAEKEEGAANPVLLASEVKRAGIDLLPELSELRMHHLVACVLRGSGFPAQAVLGRERATDIVAPAYWSWVEIAGIGVVTTSSDVDLLCDEMLRLPCEKSVSE